MLLQPLQVRDPGRLVALFQRNDVINLPLQLSYPDFNDIREGSTALTGHVAFHTSAAHVSIPGQSPERAWIEAVTPDAFATMSVPVALGRALQPSDGERAPGIPVAVLTYPFWQSRFGGDPAVIDRTVLINAQPFTVVGVTQPGFESFSASLSVALFVPSGTLALLRGDDGFFKYRATVAWRVLAYLAPHATVADANAELALFAQRFAKEFPEEHRHTRFQAVLEQFARPDPATIDFLPIFVSLFIGLVILVLFIACANVANLMSARALARERELVVRAALGASRARLIRQLLIESLLLAAIAGLVGYGLASWSGDLFLTFIPQGDIPMRQPVGREFLVLAFTAMLSLVAGLAAGLFPALRSSRIDINQSLKQGTSQSGTSRHRFRNMLVVGQVATSCIVLIASALFLRGLTAARDLNLGFRPENLLMLSFDLKLQGYDQTRGRNLQKQLLERVRTLPGVADATFAQHVPFGQHIVIRNHWPENPTAPLPDGRAAIAFSGVEPGFIKMLGIPLLRGRDLLPSDDEKAPQVAVINQAMADAFWPGQNPIGQHFRRDWNGAPPIEVVGVVATGKYVMLTEPPKPYYYTPFAQFYNMPATLLVRTLGEPHALAHTLRETVRALDPDLPIYNLVTLDEHMKSSVFALMPLRMGATMAAIQGVIGLVLAIMGLYAVVSYGVTRRTREIGIRVALGATPSSVVRFVAREALRLTLTGLIAGLLMSLALGFALSHVLFGVRAIDPLAFPAVIALLVTTTALACYYPARRATKVNPICALLSE